MAKLTSLKLCTGLVILPTMISKSKLGKATNVYPTYFYLSFGAQIHSQLSQEKVTANYVKSMRAGLSYKIKCCQSNIQI